MPGSGQKHSLVALVLPLAWYVGTRVHLGACSLEEVTRAVEAGRKPCAQEEWIPEPCHPPWAGKKDRGLMGEGFEEQTEAQAPPESWEYQTGPAWEPV